MKKEPERWTQRKDRYIDSQKDGDTRERRIHRYSERWRHKRET